MIKKYIILDDLDYKRERIAEYVRSIVPDAEIEELCCERDFMNYMREFWHNKEKRQEAGNMLLFLDWNFPFYANEHIEVNAGEHVLLTLNLRHVPMKVVVVSSEEVDGLEEYEMVLGQITDEPSVYQEDEYKKFISMAEETEE